MSSSQGKQIPKDTQIIVSIMKDMGISEYDQQVLNHLLEFNYRYTTLLLDDAKAFSNFAGKKIVDVDDVKMAIQLAQDGVFTRPPTIDVLMKAANKINKTPLPVVKSGLKIAQDQSNFLQTSYKLKTDMYIGGNERKIDTKRTALKVLEESRKIEPEDHSFIQSDLLMENSMDFDLNEMIRNHQRSQETIGENRKEEIMDSQPYENQLFPDIAFDGTVEKHDES